MSDLEALKEKLRGMGINPDDPAWMKARSVDLGQLPLIQANRDALTKLVTLLEAQTASDEAQIQALRERLAREKRGGGQ